MAEGSHGQQNNWLDCWTEAKPMVLYSIWETGLGSGMDAFYKKSSN